jgi:two-component system, chemotaxis family, protein-glutamate methylesterase/glutaminase
MSRWTAARSYTGESAVPFDLLVIGSSASCSHLLPQLLQTLPAGFPVPVVVAQHRLVGDKQALTHFLQRSTSLTVMETEDKQPLEAGYIYLAPADYHLLVEDGHCALSTEPPVWFARPSIDVLFESAADAYGERLAAVLLTDDNQDGVRGLAAVRDLGGVTVAPALADREGNGQKMMVLSGAGEQRLMTAAVGPFLLELVMK